MAKDKTVYICTQCGYESPKYWGKCPDCSSWNTMEEKIIQHHKNSLSSGKSAPKASITRFSQIQETETIRISTGIPEFDTVLGGGIVPASLILIGGTPGIGKSTLLMQAAGNLAQKGRKVYYLSAEESTAQLKMRASRLGSAHDDIRILTDNQLEHVIASAQEEQPDVLMIDSIQTVLCSQSASLAGSISQVRECCAMLMDFAKTSGCTVFMVGHVTKQGTLAGPRTVEHMVDTVLYFENQDNMDYRIIRAEKNRFGSTNEVGIFEMSSGGLISVKNPSEMLIAGKIADAIGSSVGICMEGTRPMLIEFQALGAQSGFATPRRMSAGFEYNRFVLLLAVIEKFTNMKLFNYDIYLNVAGGLKINEPAADTAVAAAVLSSLRNKALPHDMLVTGEIGLSGEIRSVPFIGRRIHEAAQMGYKKIIIPEKSQLSEIQTNQIEIIKVGHLYQLIKALFPVN